VRNVAASDSLLPTLKLKGEIAYVLMPLRCRERRNLLAEIREVLFPVWQAGMFSATANQPASLRQTALPETLQTIHPATP
jgi:hypothetical protein